MPVVYPNLNAVQLDALLKQSSWAKYSRNVEVFEEAGRGRGVRLLSKVKKSAIICWYSTDVFDFQQDDKVYQVQNGNLFACVSDFEGQIQYVELSSMTI